MTQQPYELSAIESARRIARGELTSEALVISCLDRIAAREDAVHAWAFLDPEYAVKQARAIDRERPRSLLHGVPVGIKDVIDTSDMPTEYNSPIYRGHRPKSDSACVALLRKAGCVLLGKTVTTEFAYNHPSCTRNPHNLAHTPGGSSSGSAAAVADRMIPLALSTQTGGSTIRPAAFCGTVGYKPSFNTINRAGLKFLAESLDTIGVLARNAVDAMTCVHILSDRALPDFSSTAPRTPRIGLCRTSRWDEVDNVAQAEIERVADLLGKAGAEITEFALEDNEILLELHDCIMSYEAARALAWEYLNHRDQFSTSLCSRLRKGWAQTREGYDTARTLGRTCRRRLADLMGNYDFLLTPAAPGEAPAGNDTTGSSLFNRAWTALGVPCVTVPSGKGARGLPLGVQLVGQFDRDSELLSWAHWAERRIA